MNPGEIPFWGAEGEEGNKTLRQKDRIWTILWKAVLGSAEEAIRRQAENLSGQRTEAQYLCLCFFVV